MLVSGIALGLIVGLLAGGDLRRLASLRIHWWLGFVAAIALRAIALVPVGIDLQRVSYLTSLCLLVGVALVNLGYAGAAAIAVGITLNLLVISLNGGVMPVAAPPAAESGYAYDPLHRPMEEGAALSALADVIPVLGGFYSIGDVLLAFGLFRFTFRALKPV
jgi:hypothetical protein